VQNQSTKNRPYTATDEFRLRRQRQHHSRWTVRIGPDDWLQLTDVDRYFRNPQPSQPGQIEEVRIWPN